jgi:hypothetical protein
VRQDYGRLADPLEDADLLQHAHGIGVELDAGAYLGTRSAHVYVLGMLKAGVYFFACGVLLQHGHLEAMTAKEDTGNQADWAAADDADM